LGTSQPGRLHITMRQYLRHPSDIPIAYHVDAVVASGTDHLRNISQGGLCFNARSPIAPGSSIHVEIPIAEPVFEADGIVVWCRSSDGNFEVGVRFDGVEADYSVRMVEQVCHIEHYRQETLRSEGRVLTGEEAAMEWIERNAAQFPR
jgi:hypothetical protein